VALKRSRLAQRRKAVGHSQESLAGKLGVDRTTVVRWERAESEPQPWIRPGLADALQVSPDELTGLLSSVEEANTRRSERFAYVLKNPRTADLPTANYLRQQFNDLAQEYDRKPSTSVLPSVGHLHAEITFLRSHALGDGIRKTLGALEAASATLVGQLVWDASQRRDCRTALGYYEQAIDAARRGVDPTTEAHARLRTSFIALYGDRDPSAGLTHASHAAEIADSSGTHALSGLALLHVAEANAMMGDRAACERTLGQAEDQLGRVNEADPARELIAPEQLGRMAGSCYLFLGEPKRAQPLLEAVSIGLPERKKSRAIVLGNLALARLRQRQVDGALEALHEAIDLIEGCRGGGALNVLFAASRELRPWRNRPDV
jgi:transcriptional regulator with XRE-family HTH domain